MDATVEQIDGYRFVYLLPFAADAMFVEDTYYSDTPDLGRASDRRARIDAYAAAQGWRVDAVAARGNRRAAGRRSAAISRPIGARPATGVAKAGMRAGLFHPTDRLFAARRGAASPR